MSNPYVLLIVTVFIYAGNILVGKVVTSELPPFTLSLLRFCIAFCFLLPLGIRELLAHKGTFKKEWKVVLTMSLLGIILFNALLYFSLVHTSSINAGILEATTPIFAMILGYFFLKETLTKTQLFGVFLSLIGVIWIITKGSLEVLLGLSFNIGDVTMCLAMASWASYSILVKKHNWKFPLYGGVLLMMALGIIGLFPLALTEWDQLQSVHWSNSVLLGLLFVGIFPSVIALMSWNKAVQVIGPSRSSVFLNLIPVVTACGAVIFLGESLTLLQAFGGLLVIAGVLLTTTDKLNWKTKQNKKMPKRSNVPL